MNKAAILAIVSLLGSAPIHAEELKPDYARMRRALERDRPALIIPSAAPELRARVRQGQPDPRPRPDSVWEGLLIGAAVGGVGGYVWARNICGSNDTECFVITAPVGILGGAGIGALVGAVADKLHK